MKILEVELENFARIYAGLGLTHLKINFRDVKENINIFVGMNGSGKTSIQRCLHPFPYNSATGDDAVAADVFIKGKDGKKTITIQRDDGKVYYIQHIYTRKKDESMLVKSYIREDNEELNASGIGMTFREIVLEKLGIDETYLTLLSISDSVKGFVEYTSSDRKKYASRIFSELDLYSRKYKDVSSMDRNMNSLLVNVADKLNRYANINREELKTQIEELTKNIDLLNSKRSQNMQSIGGIQNQLRTYQNIIQEYRGAERELTLQSEELAKLKKNTYYSDSLSEIRTQMDVLDGKITDKKLELNTCKNTTMNLLEKMEESRNTMHSKEEILSKIDTNENLEELKEFLVRLKEEREEIEKSYQVTKSIPWSKNQLIQISMYLEELNRLCNRLLYEVTDQSIIIPTYQKYKKDSMYGSNMKYDLLKLEKSYENQMSICQNHVGVKVPKIEYTESHKCPYKDFYTDYTKAVDMMKTDNTSKLESMAQNISKLRDICTANDIFRELITYVNTNTHADLTRIPEIFHKDTFIQEYMENKICYDENKMIALIDYRETLDKYQELSEKIKDTESKLSIYQSNYDVYQSIQTEITKLSQLIEEFHEKYTAHKVTFQQLTEELESLEKEDIYLRESESIVMQIEKVSKEISEISNHMKTMNDDMNKISGLQTKLEEYTNENTLLTSKIAEATHKRDDIRIQISNIESLEAEQVELKNKYDLISNVKFALSPTTGLPLEYIEYYVKEEMIDQINELLESIYHGRFYLLKDEVVIDDKEFTIPYMKNYSNCVSDISKASDGEKAILSLVISLVLLQMTQSGDMTYNILLLDEIDAKLDTFSRGKFIELLEIYMKMIHAEQIFLISHNNMFDSYPVNILMTSVMNTINYINASVMKLYEM